MCLLAVLQFYRSPEQIIRFEGAVNFQIIVADFAKLVSDAYHCRLAFRTLDIDTFGKTAADGQGPLVG